MVKFHETLSEESVYYRYFSQLKLDQRVAHERLTRICFNDYDREIALVAEHKDPKTGEDEPLMVKFHETLSEESVYYRYFSQVGS